MLAGMPTRFLAFLLLIISVLPCAAIDAAHYRELNVKARAAAKQQDWKTLRATLAEIGKELPAPTPGYLLRVASVEVHLGHNAEALQWLARFAEMGLQYDVAADDDLKPLLADPGYAPIAATMAARTKPIAASELACSLPMLDVMPEDVTYDHFARAFVVTSVQHHTLYQLRLPEKDEVICSVREAALEEAAKRWPTLAVRSDPARSVLWVTTAAMPGFSGFPAEDEGKSALLAIKANGQVVRRFEVGTTAAPAVLGDMAIGLDGS